MKNILRRIALYSSLLSTALLFACAAPEVVEETPKPIVAPEVKKQQPEAPPVVAPVSPPLVNDVSILKEGIGLYNNGEYNAAINRLNTAPEIWVNGSKNSQLEALKYMAFSYCLTARQTLCRQQFEKALKLDPNFDLAPGEKGHPQWGPVFNKAKKSKKLKP